MKKILRIIKFNFLKELNYPYEILGFIFRKIIAFGFLILFWQVLSTGNKSVLNQNQIISYFLISQAVTDLTFANDTRFGREIQKLIKTGQISNYLIKPMHAIKLLFLSFIGEKLTIFIYSLITLIIGIFLQTSTTPQAILLFIICLLLTTLTGLGINIFIGSIGFFSPEAGSIQNMFNHMTRVFSGTWIPLNLFPEYLKNIISYSFFPVLAYYPTILLQEGSFNSSSYEILSICAFWSLFCLGGSLLLWKKSLKSFEGVGI